MLDQIFHSYLKVEKQYSIHTLEAYQSDLANLEEFLNREEEISCFDEAEVQTVHHRMLRAWMGELFESGLSARSVARKISSVKTYFNFLQRNEKVSNNPAARIKVPKFDKKLPAFLKESETENLFDLIEFDADFEGIRDKAMLELLYGCGLRRSELLGLKLADLDFYNMQVLIRGKGNKERIVPFGKHVKQSLEQYMQMADEEGFGLTDVFFRKKDGAPIYSGLIYRRVKKYLGQVSSLAQKSPHVLRHTFATHLLDNGADLNAIKELLGHSSLASTQVYTHNSIKKLQRVYQQAHPRASNHKDDSI